jgi:hypothetical protein
VIRGNYKLVVLGRQGTDDAFPKSAKADDKKSADDRRADILGNAAGVEMSGGLVDDDSGDLAASTSDLNAPLDVRYEWTPDSKGGWTWTQTTVTGKENPKNGDNYRIVNQTWVDYQSDTVGSPDRRVSEMKSETYVSDISSSTDFTGLNETSTVSMSPISRLVSNTMTLGPVFNNTMAAAVHTLNLVTASVEADIAAMIAVAQVAGLIATFQRALVVDEHVGMHIDTHLSPHVDTHSGEHMELHVLPHIDSHTGSHVDTHLGPHVDRHTKEHFELHTGTHMSKEDDAVSITSKEIKVNDKVIAAVNDKGIMVAKENLTMTEQKMVSIAKEHYKI